MKFTVRSLYYLSFILLCSCSILPKQGKITEIENAYKHFLETPNSKNLRGWDYKVKYCGGICSGSITGRYYVNIFNNACDGRVNIEEKCSDKNTCTYTFDENSLAVCF